MIIDDSRNVLAHLKAELHEESAVKASADMNIGDIVYLEMDENDGLTLRNGYATRRKYVVIIGKNEKGNLVGSLIVNSKITPFKRTAVMQQYQYLLRQSDYPQILNYDSWLDCTELFELDANKIVSVEVELKGKLTETDLANAMNLVKRCGFINRQAKEKFGLL